MNSIHVKEQNVTNYLLLTALLIHAIMVGLVSMLTTILFAVAHPNGMEQFVIKKLSNVHLTHVVKMDSVRTKKTDSFANAKQDGKVFFYLFILIY